MSSFIKMLLQSELHREQICSSVEVQLQLHGCRRVRAVDKSKQLQIRYEIIHLPIIHRQQQLSNVSTCCNETEVQQ